MSSSRSSAILAVLLCAHLAACSGDGSTGHTGDGSTQGDGQNPLGDGFTADALNPYGDAIVPPRCGELVAIVRDFKAWADGDGHEDFENVNANEPDYDFSSGSPQWTDNRDAYLDTTLDAEGKPKYLLGDRESPAGSIHGEAGYSQWYRDVAGVNMRFEVPIVDQDPSADRFLFDSDALPGGQFFPIDDQGFGNQGNEHNFHFTTELRGTFRYNGGEVFTFSGDDDVYVFVNNKLALDIGGVHGAQSATIDFDAIADWLGIVPGGNYSLALFHAERHTVKSNFRFETSIRCFTVR